MSSAVNVFVHAIRKHSKKCLAQKVGILGSIFWSLSGVLEVKYDLDRTGMKKWIKTAKIACIGMWPRMHFLDLQHLYVFWTAGLMTAADFTFV